MAKRNQKDYICIVRRFILGIYNKQEHNMLYYRSCMSMLSGTAIQLWNQYEACAAGHLNMFQYFEKRAMFFRMNDCKECALKFGNSHIVEYMRAILRPRYDGADFAATNGCLEDIRSLHILGIHCSESGMKDAVQYGHLEVVRELMTHGMRFTYQHANCAARYGHLEIVREFALHGIQCTIYCLQYVVARGNLELIRIFQANGMHPTSEMANDAMCNGHAHVVDYLADCGIYCTSSGADYAAAHGYLHMIVLFVEH